MKTKLTSKILLVFMCNLLFFACNPEERKGFVNDTISPKGKYRLIGKHQFSTGSQINPDFEDLTTDCDLLSTLDLKSNGTLDFIDYNFDSDNDCSNFLEINGSWDYETCPDCVSGTLNLGNDSINYIIKNNDGGDFFFGGFRPTICVSHVIENNEGSLRYEWYFTPTND